VIDVWAVAANGLWVVGLAATSGPWWQRVFWAPLAGACVVDAAVARPHREGGTDDVP